MRKTKLELTTERHRLLDQAVLGFGLSESQSERLNQVETEIRAIEQEELVGPHSCPDWDEMELKAGAPEFACCTCRPPEKAP